MKRLILFLLLLCIAFTAAQAGIWPWHTIRVQREQLRAQSATIARLEALIAAPAPAQARREYSDGRIWIHYDEASGFSYRLRPQKVTVFVVENKKKKFSSSCVDNFGNDIRVTSTQYIKTKGK